MDITIVHAIQSLANPVLDVLMYIFTKCGEQVFFMIVFATIYWCISKSAAIRLGLIYCASAAVNNGIKAIVKRPRPYVQDSTVRNLHTCGGYSFPSGHSQSYSVQATTVGFMTFEWTKKRWIRVTYIISAIVLGVLVGLSRVYFGQHFLTDVLAGLAMGALVGVIGKLIVIYMPEKLKNFGLDNVLIFGVIIALVATIIMLCLKVSHVSIYKYISLFIGLSVGHLLNSRFLHFDPKTTKVNKWITLVAGMLLTSGVYALCSIITDDVVRGAILHLVVSFTITFIVPALTILFEKFIQRRKVDDSI